MNWRSSNVSGASVRAPTILLWASATTARFTARIAGEELLFTTDQMIEGVHFTNAQSPAAIGERALARSLSDIAAMGGDPRFCLVALAASNTEWIETFYRGLLRLAKRTGTALAGGDLARDEKFHCDVMVCGAVPRGKALRRDGACPGDSIFVSGKLGKPWDRPIQPRLAPYRTGPARLGDLLYRPQ